VGSLGSSCFSKYAVSKYPPIEDDKTFELVTSIHVLEHTTNPMRELEWYKSLATKYVLIEVPGISAKGGALRFAHLWYFPPKVLADMMVKCGMKIVEIDESSNTRILGKVV